MQIIREKIRFNSSISGNTINFKIPFGSNDDFLGYQQEIDNLTEFTTTELVNPVTDVEKRKLNYYNVDVPILTLQFFSSPTFYSAGFTNDDIATGDNFPNSYFILDFYDTYDVNTQTKIFSTYLTKKGVMTSSAITTNILGTSYTVVTYIPPVPIYVITESNQIYYWYVPLSYLTGSTMTGYVKFSFYNAKTGKIQLFYNDEKANDPAINTTPEKMYFEAELDKVNKSWKFTSTSEILKAIEITNTNLYAERVNNTFENMNNIAQAYPTGNTFLYASGMGTYGSNTLSAPILLTNEITSITLASAIGGGNVIYDGGKNVTARGVVWSTTNNPTTILSTKTSDGTGTGVFTSTITGFVAGTTYYVRAYAVNSRGTGYGNEVSFLPEFPPVLTTTAISAIGQTTATGGGNVSSDGGSAVTVRGIVWSTTANPTTALSTKTSNGTGTGAFTSSMTGLAMGTKYYIRAYATNTVGTSYGNQVSFTTLAVQPATVTTMTMTVNSSTTASGGGNVTGAGGGTISARGLVYGTSANPTILNSYTVDGSGTGTFTSSLSSLLPYTTYYVRAYAINEAGIVYGNQVSFVTVLPPTVITTEVTSLSQTSMTAGGNVTDSGGANIWDRGIYWNTTSPPTLVIHNGTGTGVFASTISTLAAGTVYYYQAFACNAANLVGKGAICTFTTLAAVPPTVTMDSVTVSTSTTAIGYGTVTASGGALVAERGIVYKIGGAPSCTDNKTPAGSTGTGAYSTIILGLSPGTTYCINAYACNAAATTAGMGTPITFTTSAAITAPVVTTTAISAIEQETAIGGGNVTSDGGAAVTMRGIVVSITTGPIFSDAYTTFDGTGTGIFTSTITGAGLVAGTTYYVRAYATNSVGTSYGSQVSFTTAAATPIVVNFDNQNNAGWCKSGYFNLVPELTGAQNFIVGVDMATHSVNSGSNGWTTVAICRADIPQEVQVVSTDGVCLTATPLIHITAGERYCYFLQSYADFGSCASIRLQSIGYHSSDINPSISTSSCCIEIHI